MTDYEKMMQPGRKERLDARREKRVVRLLTEFAQDFDAETIGNAITYFCHFSNTVRKNPSQRYGQILDLIFSGDLS